MAMGVADFPIETLKLLNIHSQSKKGKEKAKTNDTARKDRPTTPKSVAGTLPSAGSSNTALAGVQTPSTSVSEAAPETPEVVRHSSSSELTRTASPGTLTTRGTFMAQAMAASTQVSRSRRNSQENSCPVSERFHHGRAKSTTNTELRSEAGTHATFSDKLHNMNVDSAVVTGKGIGRIVGAGVKSPLDFSMNVSKGFHNIPKLMGGDVRQVDKVTDFQSGMRTAAKVGEVHSPCQALFQPLMSRLGIWPWLV